MSARCQQRSLLSKYDSSRSDSIELTLTQQIWGDRFLFNEPYSDRRQREEDKRSNSRGFGMSPTISCDRGNFPLLKYFIFMDLPIYNSYCIIRQLQFKIIGNAIVNIGICNNCRFLIFNYSNCFYQSGHDEFSKPFG